MHHIQGQQDACASAVAVISNVHIIYTKMSNGAAANRDKDCPKVHLSIGDKYISVDVIGDTTTTHEVVERIKNEQIEEVSSASTCRNLVHLLVHAETWFICYTSYICSIQAIVDLVWSILH